MLTHHHQGVRYVNRATGLGAISFLLKPMELTELLYIATTAVGAVLTELELNYAVHLVVAVIKLRK
jgi:hypothetical protein